MSSAPLASPPPDTALAPPAVGERGAPSLLRLVPLIAGRMLWHNRPRLIFTVIGIAGAFFLAAAQFGLLVGWINTITALIRHAPADLWVMAEQTPAFDYGTAIPRQRIFQARSVPGVAWAEGLFMAWNIWQRPDGRRVNIELVGLDISNQGGPWLLQEGTLANIRRSGTVIVDELFLRALGVRGPGDSVELIGQRAEVGGVSRGVRTFTASPFVFTSLEQAIRYDRRYRDDEVTYVMVRCAPGADVRAVQAEMRQRLPAVEVLTAAEFSVRSVRYWMLETGIGITVVLTAALGLGVGAVIMSQALFAITNDHLSHYAVLLALGFRARTLVACVVGQALLLGAAGIAGGALLFFAGSALSARTSIPLETTPAVFAALVAAALMTGVTASWLAVRTILRLDPVSVFSR